MAPGPDDGKADTGAKLFKAKCATCHTCNEGGPNKQGPNLFGVLGRQSGQVAGFKYTEANKGSGIVWSNQTMFDYLANPKKCVRASKLFFCPHAAAVRTRRLSRVMCVAAAGTSRAPTWPSRASRRSRTAPTSSRTSIR